MKRRLPSSTFPALCIAAALLCWASPSRAVIVAGANGGGDNSNNTTSAQLNAYLSGGSNVFGGPTGPFDFYDNVIPYSDSTGLYLGYDAATKDIWILSAKHVTDSSGSVTVDGLSYNFEQRFNLSGDLELNRYSRPDMAVPSLPAISLATGAPSANAPMVVIGIGRDRVEAGATSSNDNDSVSLGGGITGYTWAASKKKRWGTNHVDAQYADSEPGVLGSISGSTAFSADFDKPANGAWLSSTEAIGALNDSGGSAFFWTGSAWTLGGIFSGATILDLDSNGSDTGDGSPFRSPLTWRGSVFTDVATYAPAISSQIGTTLIPEPGTGALLLGALAAAACRRRREARGKGI